MHITIKMTMSTKAIKAAIGNLFLQMKLYNYKQKLVLKTLIYRIHHISNLIFSLLFELVDVSMDCVVESVLKELVNVDVAVEDVDGEQHASSADFAYPTQQNSEQLERNSVQKH